MTTASSVPCGTELYVAQNCVAAVRIDKRLVVTALGLAYIGNDIVREDVHGPVERRVGKLKGRGATSAAWAAHAPHLSSAPSKASESFRASDHGQTFNQYLCVRLVQGLAFKQGGRRLLSLG